MGFYMSYLCNRRFLWDVLCRSPMLPSLRLALAKPSPHTHTKELPSTQYIITIASRDKCPF